MLRLIQHTDLNHAVGDATDARRDRGDARPVVPGVAYHRHIGAEQIAFRPRAVDGRGAFLLALDQSFTVTGVASERPKRCGVDPTPTCRRRSLARTGGRREPRDRTAASPTARAGLPLDVVVGGLGARSARPQPVDLAEDRRVPAISSGAGYVRYACRLKMSRVLADARTFAGRRPDIPSTGSAPGVRDQRSSVASASMRAMARRRSWARTIPQLRRVAPRASFVCAPSRVYRKRSWSRNARACRTRSCLARCGTPPQNGRGTSSPGYIASNSVNRDISSSRADSTVLAHARTDPRIPRATREIRVRLGLRGPLHP